MDYPSELTTERLAYEIVDEFDDFRDEEPDDWFDDVVTQVSDEFPDLSAEITLAQSQLDS